MERKKKVIVAVALTIAVLIASFYFDREISIAVSSVTMPFFMDLMAGVGFASSQIIIFFVLTSFFLWSEGKRKWILPLWFTLLISQIASFFLKVTIQRMRPFQEGIVEMSPLFTITDKYYLWDFSFPSAQTAIVFCAVPILSKEFPKLKWLWIALAVLVGLSRIYFGFHFMSDVIAGATIGLLLGMLVIKAEKETGFWERINSRIKHRFMR